MVPAAAAARGRPRRLSSVAPVRPVAVPAKSSLAKAAVVGRPKKVLTLAEPVKEKSPQAEGKFKTPSPPKRPKTPAAKKSTARRSTRKTPARSTKNTLNQEEEEVESSSPELKLHLTPSPLRKELSEVDDDLFKDVQIVVRRLDKSPRFKTTKVDANAVFDALEQVKQSPDRVEQVVRRMERAVTPGRLTRSARKVIPKSRKSAMK